MTKVSLPLHLEKTLLAKASVLNLKQGAVLFSEGAPALNLFLLEQGSVKLHLTTPNGKTTIIRIVQPGETFGEVECFLKTTYPYTATSLTPSRIWLINYEQFLPLLAQEMSLLNWFLICLARQISNLYARLAMRTYPNQVRVKKLLSELQETNISLTAKEIAEYLGVCEKTVYRALRRARRSNTSIPNIPA